MQTTPNLGLKKPESNEYVNVTDVNNNTDLIDTAVAERVESSGGDISETIIETLEPIDAKYPVPSAGESTKVFMGKVKKYIEDTKPLDADMTVYVATTGSDTTGTGASTAPYKTINYAINTIPKDLGGYTVLVQVADGTYDEDVQIIGFNNGYMRIYTNNAQTSLSTACSVRSFVANHNNCYVIIDGFNITATTTHAVTAYKTSQLAVRWCLITGTSPGNYGIYCAESPFLCLELTIKNKNVAIYAFNCDGVVKNARDSTGNNNGVAVALGTVKMVGSLPIGISADRQSIDGGTFINSNGTQISDMITTGLSCTWGTIRSGYYRNGNMVGRATIQIQTNTIANTKLTAGMTYIISGFPHIENTYDVAVVVDRVDLAKAYLQNNGSTSQIILTPRSDITAGIVLIFNATYVTDL